MNNIRSKPPIYPASKKHFIPHQSKYDTIFMQISHDSQPIQTVNYTNSSELCTQLKAEKRHKLRRKDLEKYINVPKIYNINLTDIKKEDQSKSKKEKCIPINEKPKKNKDIRESKVTYVI